MNAKDIVHNFAVVVIIIQAALFLLGWLYTVVVVGFIVFNGLLQMGGGRPREAPKEGLRRYLGSLSPMVEIHFARVKRLSKWLAIDIVSMMVFMLVMAVVESVMK